MKLKDIMAQIATIYNILTEISVKGDNVIKLANAMQMARELAFSIQGELNKETKDDA